MNARQQAFVNGILAGKTAKAAYIEAGYKAKDHAAEANAGRLLRNAEVVAAISQSQQKASVQAGASAVWILQRLIEEATPGSGTQPGTRIGALKLLANRIGFFDQQPESAVLDLERETAVVRAALQQLTDEELDQLGRTLDTLLAKLSGSDAVAVPLPGPSGVPGPESPSGDSGLALDPVVDDEPKPKPEGE